MKKIKTIVSLLVAASLFVLALGVNRLPVSAEEEKPVTYVIKYVQSADGWYYQKSSEGHWRSDQSYRELYYMRKSIKDGDILVIDGCDEKLELTLSVKLNNITFIHTRNVIVTANVVDNVYVLKDSFVAVNGDVVNAHVYDNACVNFNSNVTNLYIREDTKAKQTISVVGTVGYSETSDKDRISEQLYSFPENTFRMEKGSLKTEAVNYSIVPPVVEVSPTAEIPVAAN